MMLRSESQDTVLFVDDEESIINALRRELYEEEYRCLFAQSGEEALRIMETESVSVIVSDMKMPGMDGLKLLREVKEKYPSTVRMVLSGYTQMLQLILSVNQAEIFKFITKPWNMGNDLKDVIRQAVDYYRMQTDRRIMEQTLRDRNAAYQRILKNIDNVISAAKSNSILFAAMGSKAFEMAAEALDHPDNRTLVKNQLMMASDLMSTLGKMDFEEYRDIRVSSLCENISSAVTTSGRIEDVQIERTPILFESVRMKHSLLTQFTVTSINALTSFPGPFAVKIKPNITVTDGLRKFELVIAIMDHKIAESQETKAERERQQAYIGMLNIFAGNVLSVMGGEFQGVLASGVVILKTVIRDYTEQ